MDEQQQELFTVAEAAAAWGVTPQAVYQRLTNLTKQGFVFVKGKKRYVTREGVEAYQAETKEENQGLQKNQPTLPTLQSENERLTKALQDAETRAASLQATVTAQEAHIDSLRRALDAQQALHMASLQQRLPAPRGGFMEWVRGWGKKQDGR